MGRKQDKTGATLLLWSIGGLLALLVPAVILLRPHRGEGGRQAVAPATTPSITYKEFTAPLPVVRNLLPENPVSDTDLLTVRVVDADEKKAVEDAWIVLFRIKSIPETSVALERITDPVAFEVLGYRSPLVTEGPRSRIVAVLAGAPGMAPRFEWARLFGPRAEHELTLCLDRLGAVEVTVRSTGGEIVDGIVALCALTPMIEHDLRSMEDLCVLDGSGKAVKSDFVRVNPRASRRPRTDPVESQIALTLERAMTEFANPQALLAPEGTVGSAERFGYVRGGRAVFDDVSPSVPYATFFWADGAFSDGHLEKILAVPGERAQAEILVTPTPFCVRGRVLRGGSPAGRATVSVFSAAGSVDAGARRHYPAADGSFSFKLNRDHLFIRSQLSESNTGYAIFERIHLEPGVPLEMVFDHRDDEKSTTGDCNVLRGRVTDSVGLPVTEADVDLGICGLEAVTDADGFFNFYGLEGLGREVSPSVSRDHLLNNYRCNLTITTREGENRGFVVKSFQVPLRDLLSADGSLRVFRMDG